VVLSFSSLFFLTMSGRMVPAMAIVDHGSASRMRGSFMSVTSSVQQMAAAFASYFAGLIVTRGPQGQLLHYGYVGGIAIAFSIVAALLVGRVKPAEHA